MSKPTPEYYQAKADLCEKLAIQQIFSGNTDMGMRNIMRMTHALAELQLQEKEEEKMTYKCEWCGDTGNKVLDVVNGQNTCELCMDLAKEGENE